MNVLLVWLFVVSFEFSHLLKLTSYLWHQTVCWLKNNVRELFGVMKIFLLDYPNLPKTNRHHMT